MPIQAHRMVRKMRGGAQAHLLETGDGAFYVVKFLSNPQHRRILVNEWIASVVLRYLQISSPEVSLIEVTPEFLARNPEVGMQIGARRVPVEPGWHFGSRYPGDPSTTAVYDFVPDALLTQINNLSDFAGCFVFDKWMANSDGRQSVFHRAELKSLAGGSSPRRMGFVALMIDHGFVFNGPHWDFPESPVQGVYPRRAVYDRITSIAGFQPWLDRVTHFPEHVIDQAFRQIPPQWTAGEEGDLERLLEKLLRRCKRVPDLINDARLAKTNPFANWR
ncbi:MAG: hypothetical protein M3Z09_11760 [Acidobacteriota bacterium]|nr:hypothetical protein [Acidobacteriota bacterium]